MGGIRHRVSARRPKMINQLLAGVHIAVLSPLLSNLYLNEVDRIWSGRRKRRAAASTPTSSTHVLPMIW